VNKIIELNVNHIFDKLAYFIAQSEVWGSDTNISKERIFSERLAFHHQASAIVELFNGTQLRPGGTPLIEYKNVYMPQEWVNELQKHWPLWYKP
jgi:hypothetical protein